MIEVTALDGAGCPSSPFGRLDHIAIVVPDTDAALKIWRDLVGLPFRFSELVQQNSIRLTHLDLGSTDLQLVEPLIAGHPLLTWIKQKGIALHHLCFEADDLDDVFTEDSPYPLPAVGDLPHEATIGRKAVFLDATQTSVTIELVSKLRPR